MLRNFYKVMFVLVMSGMAFTGCKKWDDHNAITDPSSAKDLLTQVKENADLSKFAELLTRSGYDKVIASSKTFTVFAPTNTALASLDPVIANDTIQLKLFIANHIADQSFFTSAAINQLRLPMLNGKYNNLKGNKFDEANIVVADKFAKNGVLHVIDKMVPALPNAWQVLETNTTIPVKERNYLLSLFRNVYDVTNAIQIGVDPATGKPIYQAGTDSVRTNLFWKDVHDLRTERKQYTLFLLTDAAWDAEVNKYRPYFITGNTDSTTNLASSAIVREVAVDTVYQQANLPDTILSKFGVKIGIDKSAIVQTIKTSNGVIYIMSKLDVRAKDKFQQYIIQAENYRASSVDRRGNTYFRDRFNPLTNSDFRDVLVYNHGVALFNLNYRLTNIPSIKYKAYWVALHDNINGITTTFQQKLGIGNPLSTALPYTTVNLNDYREIYLGEFTVATYQPVFDLFLVAANSTTAAVNPLVCDYI